MRELQLCVHSLKGSRLCIRNLHLDNTYHDVCVFLTSVEHALSDYLSRHWLSYSVLIYFQQLFVVHLKYILGISDIQYNTAASIVIEWPHYTLFCASKRLIISSQKCMSILFWRAHASSAGSRCIRLRDPTDARWPLLRRLITLLARFGIREISESNGLTFVAQHRRANNNVEVDTTYTIPMWEPQTAASRPAMRTKIMPYHSRKEIRACQNTHLGDPAQNCTVSFYEVLFKNEIAPLLRHARSA